MNTFDKTLRYLRNPADFQILIKKLVAMLYLGLSNRYSRAAVIRAGGPVVSLTTHGNRIHKVHLAIESIGRGDLRPSRLILWLDDVAAHENLPITLLRLARRGLEIRLCRDYGPHKKYYAHVECESSFHDPLATADDDVFYPRFWLKRLHDAYKESPETINCYFARRIQLRPNGIAHFLEWPVCQTTEPKFRHHAIGMSGVIYPPRFLSQLKRAGTGFIDCCPKADDLWLHVQALRAGYKIRQIAPRAIRFLDIPGTGEVALWKENGQGGNDAQAEKTYTRTDIDVLRQELIAA